MALRNPFSRNRPTLDAPEATGAPDADGLAANTAVHRNQKLVMGGIAGAGLLATSLWMFGGSGNDAASDTKAAATDVEVSTNDMVNRNLSDKEWQAASENRFQSAENQLKAVGGTQTRVDELAAQVAALQAQNSGMASDGQRVLSAYQTENEQLRRQINEAPPPSAPPPGPAAMYGPGGPSAYQPSQAPAPMAAAPVPVRVNEVKLISFGDAGGTATRVEKGNTVFTDSINYLPPNSIATAKVIVGVDAAAGVGSQTDPLPVLLRVTGPARSVFQNGKLLTTRIQGCLINGAARGELSSEKVYIKLQKMTCPQPGGRYAVSEVKGFVAFGGKTGVRGRVVSREGSLISQAFMAGLVGGFGRGFSANAQQLLTAPTVSVGGKRQQLGLGDIAQGGLGEGVSQTGDMVSKYLIERAEQYQPVIEMPTGVDVEIIFLEGVHVRN
ncbi:TraB/VirB10 family protein [Sphingomonas sp. Leaf4]|uniref:TraB/VirB10 family protein n=1 Tax=Sphingomonas sp. Leaf4 TaxID=2876553 RepID=UPI001E4F1A4C|nr:TraB/VirB10 family protein [Sphingomonas sp. Leaf4]